MTTIKHGANEFARQNVAEHSPLRLQMPTLWFGTGELLTNSRIIGYDVVTMSKSEVQYRIEGAMSSWLDRHAKSR